jgi:hypothetical protein
MTPIEQLPALPDEFHKAALALPEKVRVALPSLVTALQTADAMAQYDRRINADTASINAISHAKLLLQSHLGVLLAPPTPQESGARGGSKKGCAPTTHPLGRWTVTTYRKIADHAERIDEYAEKVVAANKELSPESPA